MTPASVACGVRQPRQTVHSLMIATCIRTSSCSRQSRFEPQTADSIPPIALAKSGRSCSARTISGESPSGSAMRAMRPAYEVPEDASSVSALR